MRKYECMYCGKKLNGKWCYNCNDDAIVNRKNTMEDYLILLQIEIDDLKDDETQYSGWTNYAKRLDYLLRKVLDNKDKKIEELKEEIEQMGYEHQNYMEQTE